MNKNKNRHRRGNPSSNRTKKSVTKQSAQSTEAKQSSSSGLIEQLSQRSQTDQDSPSESTNQLVQSTDPIRLNRSLLIIGMGGVGKSSILLKLANDAYQSLSSRVQWISTEKATAFNPYVLSSPISPPSIPSNFFNDKESLLVEDKFLGDELMKSLSRDLLNSRLEFERDILIEKSVELLRRELVLRRQQVQEQHQHR